MCWWADGRMNACELCHIWRADGRMNAWIVLLHMTGDVICHVCTAGHVLLQRPGNNRAKSRGNAPRWWGSSREGLFSPSHSLPHFHLTPALLWSYYFFQCSLQHFCDPVIFSSAHSSTSVTLLFFQCSLRPFCDPVFFFQCSLRSGSSPSVILLSTLVQQLKCYTNRSN